MRVEFKGKLDILSITATDTLKSITIYESDIDDFSPKSRRQSFKKPWLIRDSYLVLHFFNVSILYVFKERTVNCTMTSWRISLNWSIYLHKHYFTNRGVGLVLKRRLDSSEKWEVLHEECKAKSLLEFLSFLLKLFHAQLSC